VFGSVHPVVVSSEDAVSRLRDAASPQNRCVTVAVQILAFVVGLSIVAATVMSAIRTIVLPHGRSANLTRLLFVSVRSVLSVRRFLPVSEGRHTPRSPDRVQG
jgi:hypothetical protein